MIVIHDLFVVHVGILHFNIQDCSLNLFFMGGG